jgi:hypothetical protein
MQTSAFNHFDKHCARAAQFRRAPLLSDRCAVSQRNCMAPRALVERVAALRSYSFLPRLSVMVKSRRGKDVWGF